MNLFKSIKGKGIPISLTYWNNAIYYSDSQREAIFKLVN